ncbi:hypothetical protein [Hymenobacter sp. IS2118]|uniref:hypothetical protein n=1 Tax=Hymenobacter sp. IS2118 TaxID=1505605 RepID=UPI0005599BE9|nr:hypothetical protein [Hymenobacter sp. IS2118]
MKKIIVLLAAFVATATTGFAQAPAGAGPVPQAGSRSQAPASPEQQAERRARALTKALSLSPDQQARLQPILLAQQQELQRLRDQPRGGDRRAMAQQLKTTQATYDQQIRAVLTPEQYSKFEQQKDDRRDQIRERRAGGGRNN